MFNSIILCNWCDRAYFNFSKIDEESNIDQNKIIQVIKENFDLSPAGIKKFLNLDKPIYKDKILRSLW